MQEHYNVKRRGQTIENQTWAITQDKTKCRNSVQASSRSEKIDYGPQES
jgi:hypothetical protein